MKLIPVDDGSDFDRMCDQLEEEAADAREAAILQALSEAVAESEVKP